MVKWLILVYFGPCLAPIGPHLGLSVSGKSAKRLSLGVLSVIPTFFLHVPLNRGFHMAIILKMPLASFLGPFEGLTREMPGP